MTERECAECRDGEHGNYDDDVKLVVIKNPDTNKIYRRSYMCNQHRQMYEDDGYDLFPQ